jgi:hypothetical protein
VCPTTQKLQEISLGGPVVSKLGHWVLQSVQEITNGDTVDVLYLDKKIQIVSMILHTRSIDTTLESMDAKGFTRRLCDELGAHQVQKLGRKAWGWYEVRVGELAEQ